MKYTLFAVVTLPCAQTDIAQQVDVERYEREHQTMIVREFMEPLAIPNRLTDKGVYTVLSLRFIRR